MHQAYQWKIAARQELCPNILPHISQQLAQILWFI